MIVKNELNNLKSNLLPLISVFPEIVVVDTGSTDGTKEFLQTLPKNVKVIHFQWTDSFAEARNQYLKAATGVWIFWLDADEKMEPRDFVVLKKCMKKGLNKAWCHYIVEGEKDYQVRLFPNISGIHYIYRCHEQVYQSLLKLGIKLYFFPRQFISIQPPSPISPPRNIRLLEMDISENPDNLMAYNWLAREHFASGEYNKGFTLIDNLLSKRDKWETPEEIYIYRFALGLKNHWLSRAILEGIALDKALLKTLITARDLAVAHNNCGTVWFNKGMLDEAISEYKQAIDINPIYVEAYINLGVAYREKGMLDESIAQHKKAIDIDPNLVIGYINLGVTYHMKGIFDEAIAQYKHVLRIDPNNADAHFNLGVAYRNKGMINEAISEYEHTVTINPDLAEAHNNLAVAYYSKNQYGLAIKHCDKAIELGFKVHPRFLQDLEQHRK